MANHKKKVNTVDIKKLKEAREKILSIDDLPDKDIPEECEDFCSECQTWEEESEDERNDEREQEKTMKLLKYSGELEAFRVKHRGFFETLSECLFQGKHLYIFSPQPGTKLKMFAIEPGSKDDFQSFIESELFGKERCVENDSPDKVLLQYINALLKEGSKDKAVRHIQKEYDRGTYSATVKLLQRARMVLRKKADLKEPGSGKNLLVGILPGYPIAHIS